jgi:hypothetical protein
MSDVFFNLYQSSSEKTVQFAGIIGAYQGLVNVMISELQTEYPLYTKEQLVDKLKLQHEQLKEKFQEANK